MKKHTRNMLLAAKQLGLSWRQIYNLLKQYRDYDRQLLALIPRKPTGGKGKPRIKLITEKIIQDVVTDGFLSQQRTKISRIVEEIHRCCKHSHLNRSDTSEYILVKSEGIIGEIATLIKRAAVLAIQSKQEWICCNLLIIIHRWSDARCLSESSCN